MMQGGGKNSKLLQGEGGGGRNYTVHIVAGWTKELETVA
jgi:hypothetical protein